MSPFRDYPGPVQFGRECFSSRRCPVCAMPRALVLQEFYEMVRRSWNAPEIDILSKAAESALL